MKSDVLHVVSPYQKRIPSRTPSEQVVSGEKRQSAFPHPEKKNPKTSLQAQIAFSSKFHSFLDTLWSSSVDTNHWHVPLLTRKAECGVEVTALDRPVGKRVCLVIGVLGSARLIRTPESVEPLSSDIGAISCGRVAAWSDRRDRWTSGLETFEARVRKSESDGQHPDRDVQWHWFPGGLDSPGVKPRATVRLPRPSKSGKALLSDSEDHWAAFRDSLWGKGLVSLEDNQPLSTWPVLPARQPGIGQSLTFSQPVPTVLHVGPLNHAILFYEGGTSQFMHLDPNAYDSCIDIPLSWILHCQISVSQRSSKRT